VNRSVIPLCNSTNGQVQETLQQICLESSKGRSELEVVGETNILVQHCLVGKRKRRSGDQNDFSNITSLHTHPQAWTQCTRFLDKHFDQTVPRIDENSTSRAAELVSKDASGQSAAICSSLAAKLFGVDILANNIQGEDDNKTTFLVLKRRKDVENDSHTQTVDRNRTLLVAVTREKSEVIAKLWEAYHNLPSIRFFTQQNPNQTNSGETWIYLFLEKSERAEHNPQMDQLRGKIESISHALYPWGEWNETAMNDACII